MKYVNYNGATATDSEVRLELDNRGFLFGDGLFETIKVSSGKINFWKTHWERLNTGMNVLRLKFEQDYSAHWFEKNILELCRLNILEEARIKIIVWRKAGGIFSPVSEHADFMICVYSFKASPELKSKVVFSQNVKSDYSLTSGFKTLSSLNYILAGIEVKERMVDDIVLFDKSGHVSECLTSNLFWIKDDIVYTPDLLTGALNGVFRRNLIERADRARIEIKHGFYKANLLLDADFVFTTNISGPSTILSIENRSFHKESVLFSKLKDLMNN